MTFLVLFSVTIVGNEQYEIQRKYCEPSLPYILSAEYRFFENVLIGLSLSRFPSRLTQAVKTDLYNNIY